MSRMVRSHTPKCRAILCDSSEDGTKTAWSPAGRTGRREKISRTLSAVSRGLEEEDLLAVSHEVAVFMICFVSVGSKECRVSELENQRTRFVECACCGNLRGCLLRMLLRTNLIF
eukprot:3401542-Rhodomonas_salina.1